MENNGQDLELNSLALDPVSPASNTSKDMLDEPAAPRRNSTDDNDPTRPRKRLAAMAAVSPEQKEAAAAAEIAKSNDQAKKNHELQQMNGAANPDSHHRDGGAEQTAFDGSSETVNPNDECAVVPGTPPLITGTGNKITIHLRTRRLSEDEEAIENLADAAGPTNDEPLFPPRSPLERSASPDSLAGDSPGGSPRSPEVEVEEIEEMDEDDPLSTHVTIVEEYVHNHVGDPVKIKEVMDAMVIKLERDPCPIRPLDEITSQISGLLASVGNHIESLTKAHANNPEIWQNLPPMMETLLRRSEPFGGNFVRDGVNGVDSVVRTVLEFAKLTALFIRYDVWNMERTHVELEFIPLSRAYQRVLSWSFRINPLYTLIDRTYRCNMLQVFPQLMAAFQDSYQGFDGLKRFEELVLERVQYQPKLLVNAYFPLEIMLRYFKALETLNVHGILEEEYTGMKEDVMQTTVDLLANSEERLATLLESHVQLLTIKEFTTILEHFYQLNHWLYNIHAHDPVISKLMEEKLQGRYNNIDPNELPSLAEWALRFPFLLRLLKSNRMDFRLHGLVRATESLVKTWREHSGQDWQETTILRYLADYILENNIVEYIMGPESHHELIRRSANIAGFLIVTLTITPDITSALWQPVADAKDPRIVQATLSMLQDLIANMTLPMQLELSERVSKMPFSSFDSYMIEFVGRLLESMRNNFFIMQQNNNTFRLGLAPFEMLIKIIRAASHEEEKMAQCGTLPPSVIFDFAAKELIALAECGPESNLRRKIFLDCVGDIREMNASGTGSTTVITAFLQKRPHISRADSPTFSDDLEYLVKELDLPGLLIKEIASFVDSHRNYDFYARLRRLKCRLDLLQFILQDMPGCLSRDSCETLWTYLVGDKALGTTERDHGFKFYHMFSSQETNPLLDDVFRTYFPALSPKNFSQGTLNFCRKAIEYLNQPSVVKEEVAVKDGVVNLAGADQLWKVILKSPDEALASQAIVFFVFLYLDSPFVTHRPAKIVEATHFKTVQQCIELLKSTALKLGRSKIQDSAHQEMDSENLEENWNELEIEFSRALDLLDQLVSGHKLRPKYNVAQKRTTDVEHINGAALTVKVRFFCLPHPSPPTEFQIGNLDTGQEFHNRISRTVGIDKFRVILSGKELRLLDEPLKTLHDFGFTDECHLLISMSPDPNASTTTVTPSALSGLNTLQAEVFRHFDDLFNLLSLSELQASKIWSFLKKFPVHERIKAKIIAEESWTEVFPINQPYKIFYSLYALRAWFVERRQEQGETSNFIVNKAIGWLLEAIMHSADKTDVPYPTSTRITMIHELLDCLRTFLDDSALKPIFPDAKGLVARLFDILQICSMPEHTPYPYSAYCAISAYNVLVEASRIDNSVWDFATQREDFPATIQRFLLENGRAEVREGSRDAIMNLCNRPTRNSVTPKQCAEFFWPILKDIISLDNLKPDFSAELFEASCSVFEVLGNTGSGILDLKAYFKDWSDRLVRYRVIEFVGRPREDYVITGYARLLELCLRIANYRKVKIKTNVEAQIFQNLLFPYPSTDPESGQLVERFPCLHGPTRQAIYNLISQLAVNQSSVRELIDINSKLFQQDRPLIDGFHADRSRWTRSLAGHVGLQNMSNTCYLNSLMTQLFMNGPFRQFIVNIPVGDSEEGRRLLWYLKMLFARMQNSYTKAIEPREFVEAISDYEGEQIDITVQMDVDEFFNLIFDRLESQMPTPELKTAFRSYYGGHLVQQVKSKECSHISEREEPFSAIQCDIKGKTSLQESLKAYVEGEVMEGDNKYSCTSCDRLVNAVKRTCLKDVPDHLILHLKRFEFDLQTMHRSKINDSFEFPTILDMKPYTMEHLSRRDDNNDSSYTPDLFELVGVLVHSGTAESGHYYSYIRNRLSPSNCPEWLEFNDSEVNGFDPSTIPNACYGGVDARDTISQQFGANKPYSAYMLFYERSSNLAGKSPDEACASMKLPLPRELEIEVQRENEVFLRKYCMFDNNYIAFVRILLEQQIYLSENSQGPCTENETKALLLGMESLEQIASRFKDSTECEALFAAVNKYCINWVACCQVFSEWLTDREEAMTNLLVCNPYLKVRQQFAYLVKVVLNQARRKRPVYIRNGDECQDDDVYDETILHRICESLHSAWDGLQWGTKAWNDYFGLVAAIAAFGPIERRCLVRFEFLRKLLELLLADRINLSKKQEYVFENFVKIWGKPRRPPLNNLADALAWLIKACDPNLKPVDDHYSRFQIPAMHKLPMSIEEHNLFSYSNAKGVIVSLNKLLESGAAVDSLGGAIGEIISAEDPDPVLQDKIKATLLSGVPVDPAHEAQPFLRCLLYYLQATKSQPHIRDVIRRVAEEIQTIGTDGGSEHLTFMRETSTLRNKNMKVGFLKFRLLECIGNWAPPLLVYCDGNVRDETESFVEELLFQPLADNPGPKYQRALDELAIGCFTFIESRLPRQRQQCDEKTFENVLRVLEHCSRYQDDDDAFRVRFDGLRAVIEKLLIEEEEDAELGTDEWGESEIPSDTQEMEVQLDDYNST
ncbi:hypothetical protein RUND412_001304 [Rhizina undulata]